MLTLFMGTVDVGRYFIFRNKLDIASNELAMMVASYNSLTPTQLNDMYRAAQNTLAPFPNSPAFFDATIQYVNKDPNGNMDAEVVFTGGAPTSRSYVEDKAGIISIITTTAGINLLNDTGTYWVQVSYPTGYRPLFLPNAFLRNLNIDNPITIDIALQPKNGGQIAFFDGNVPPNTGETPPLPVIPCNPVKKGGC
jgi:hypothetical protein